MVAKKQMTNSPRYFAFWEANGKTNSIIFDEREDCQNYISRVHLREGYLPGSLRVITGFELDIERG